LSGCGNSARGVISRETLPKRVRAATYLFDGDSLSFSDDSSQLDDRLHSLDLTFDYGIKVFLSYFGEHDEVD
jgi:hypothetical protein